MTCQVSQGMKGRFGAHKSSGTKDSSSTCCLRPYGDHPSHCCDLMVTLHRWLRSSTELCPALSAPHPVTLVSERKKKKKTFPKSLLSHFPKREKGAVIQ